MAQDIDFSRMLDELDDQPAVSHGVEPSFDLPKSTQTLIDGAVAAREAERRQSDYVDKGKEVLSALSDPQQYAEFAKGIVPGAISMGGTAIQAPDTVVARGQQGAAKFGRKQLEIMDRIDRGEAVPEMEDPIGYAYMSHEQRQATRRDQERATAEFNPTRIQDRSFYKAGEKVQKFAKDLMPAAPGYEESTGRQLGEGMGSMLFGLPLAYFGGPALAGTAFGSAGIGEATQRAVEFDRKERAAGRAGLTEDQISLAGVLGVGPGATDLLPVEILIGRLPMPIPAALRRPVAMAIGRIGGQAFIEGVQEGGQAYLQNLIAREVYNPDQKLLDGIEHEAGIGAGVGGIAQTAKELGSWMLRSGAIRKKKGVHDSLVEHEKAKEEAAAAAEPDTRTLAPSQEGPTPRLKAGEGSVRGPVDSEPAIQDAERLLSEINQGTIAQASPTLESGAIPGSVAETGAIAPVAPESGAIAPDATLGQQSVPTFQDAFAALPTNKAGDPDLAAFFAATGGRNYSDLSDAEKIAVVESFRPKAAPAAPAAAPEAVSAPEVATVAPKQEAAPAAPQAVQQPAEKRTPATQTAGSVNQGPPIGETRRIVTPDGSTEFDVTTEIVDLADLRLASGEFQPRDRTRQESEAGVLSRAASLDPSRLMPGRVSDGGAPIVAPDGTIISGNGRAMSIGEVYSNPAHAERAAAYKAALGPAAAGMERPVLIQRMAGTPSREELIRIADLSNRTSLAGMSATERAMRDARAAGPEIMQLYTGGNFTTPENREFFRSFMNNVVTDSERGQVSRNGVLTKEGEDRMSAAVLAAAYGDPDLLSRMLESTDDNIKNITGALRDAAGAFIKLKQSIAAGQTSPEFDITPQIVETARRIADLRDRNISPTEFLAQQDAFTQTDPIVEALLKAFYNDQLSRALSRAKLTELLKRYAEEAEKHQGGGLIPDDTRPTDVIRGARERAVASDAGTQGDIFAARTEPARAPDEGTGQEAGRPADAESRPGNREDVAGDAGRVTDAERARFSAVLATKEKRSNWGQAADLSEAQVQILMNEALADGRLRMLKGHPVRTAKARSAAPVTPVAAEAAGVSTVPMGRATEKRLEAITNDLAYRYAAQLIAAAGNAKKAKAIVKKMRKEPQSAKGLTRAVVDQIYNALRPGAPRPKSREKVFDEIEAAIGQAGQEGAFRDAPSSDPNLEPDWRNGPPADGLGQADVPAARGPDAGGVGAGGTALDADGGLDSGGSLFDGDAVAVGEGGDSAVQAGAPGTGSEPSGVDGGGRGGDAGLAGVPAGRVAAKEVGKLAADGAKLDKAAAQREADATVPYVANDLENIRAALPVLLPAQQVDVFKAEQRFSKPDGHGFLFTNGTGTGKTFTGLGVVKRFVRQGKTNILILAPSQGILDGWIKAAARVNLDISRLDDTTTAGDGIVATTYANLRENDALVGRNWDLIVADEAHTLSQNASGNPSEALRTFRGLTNHSPAMRASMALAQEAANLKLLEAHAKEDFSYGPELEAAKREYSAKHNALIDQYKAEGRTTKALFLSATPFAYRKSTDYAEGFLFDYPEQKSGYNNPGGQAEFLVRNFGYNMRYNRAEEPGPEVNVSVLEREFYERLKREGVLSGRRLEVDADYDRRFVLVDDAVGAKIDQALDWLSSTGKGRYLPLLESINEKFNYLAKRRLLEAIKAKHIMPRIRRDLELGRKVVVFHDYNEGSGFNPFEPPGNPNERPSQRYGEPEPASLGELYFEFTQANPYVKKLNFSQFLNPIQTLTAAFPDAMVYNGTVSVKTRRLARDSFNKDGSGKDLIIIQSDAGEAGISLHDTSGKHQRVLYNLGLPTRPTRAIQQEGRIYREGQVSNAIFRYLSTGTGWERTAFAQTIAERASTAENLALGDEARALRDSFIDAFNDASEIEQSPDEGKGGKLRDRTMGGSVTPWDRAKAFYFAEGKKSGRRDQREGKDYFATPEPIGLKMVEFADIENGERVLEPSAGHGAIARWFPEGANRFLIEPSSSLASRAGLNSPGAKVITSRFEDHYIGNKYDAIVMNPPFGTGGKEAFDHVQKALGHLREGGRVVAIVPRGPAADKRFDALMESEENKNIYLAAEFEMPQVMFERAGTRVATRILVLEKHAKPENAPNSVRRDLSNAETINELFDRMEGLSLGKRRRGNQPAPAPLVEPIIEPPAPSPQPVTVQASESAQRLMKAEELGAAAYARGAQRVPAQDRELMGMISGPVGSSGTLLDAWLRGWTEAQSAGTPTAQQITAAEPEPQPTAQAPVMKPAVPPAVPGVKFKLGETVHTKTGADLFVASIAQFVPRQTYDKVLAIAKRHKGYYSTFKGSGAIPGFQFPDETTRKAFLDEVMGKPAEEAGPELTAGTPENLAAREAAARQRMSQPDYANATKVSDGADTSQVEGFLTDEWKAARRYNIPDGANGIREVTYDEAIDYLFNKAVAKAEREGGAGKDRKAYILIGLGGAGKSTLANPLGSQRQAIHASADDAKLIIPEYDGGRNSSGVHEESSHLGKRVLARLTAEGYNIVLEKLGSSPGSIEAPIQMFEKLGYATTLVYVDVPKAVAMERAITRFEKTGRAIDISTYDLNIDETYTTLKTKEGIENATFRWNEPQGWEWGEAEAPGLAGLVIQDRISGKRIELPSEGAQVLDPLGRRGRDAGSDGGTGRGPGTQGRQEGLTTEGEGAPEAPLAYPVPPADSYALRSLNSITDPVLKGHYEALTRAGTAVDGVLGAIASDRRLDAGERQQLAELYVGEPVAGDPLQAIRDAAAQRGREALSALLHGYSPEVSPSNLRIRDLDAQMLETALSRLAERLPRGSLLVASNALRLELRDQVAALEGATMSPEAALSEFGIDAGSAKKVVAVSLEYGPDVALQTFTHEEIHLLREPELKVLTGKDWDVLAGLALRRPKKAEATRILDAQLNRGKIDQETYDSLIEQAGKLTYRQLYQIDERYGGFVRADERGTVEEKLVEETVAHAAADWAQGREFAAPIERVFQKIRDFLEAIQNALHGLGFQSANDIFESIWAGELTRKFEEAAERRFDAESRALDWMNQEGITAMAIGRVDPSAPTDASTGQSMRRDLDALGYYSQALEAAKSWNQKKGTPEQALMWLKKSGVKDAEIEATGLYGFLSMKGKSVTRDELVGHLEANRVGLTEKSYGGDNLNEAARLRAELRSIRQRPRADQDGQRIAEIESRIDDLIDDDVQQTKWSSYSLDPDNPTYRETVLHLPMAKGEFVAHPTEQGKWAIKRPDGSLEMEMDGKPRAFTSKDQRIIDNIAEGNGSRAAFRSGHFPEPNIIGHMMTSMTTHQGKPVYTVHQIQSDWGQKLRDGGVRDEAKIADLRAMLKDLQATWGAVVNSAADARPSVDRRDVPGLLRSEVRRDQADEFGKRLAQIEPEMTRVEAELRTAETSSTGNPLVNTTDQWVNTTLRRAIRQAAEAGADYIAIPTGDTVLKYNPGDTEGMRGFYGSRAVSPEEKRARNLDSSRLTHQTGIVPKNLRNLLQKIDKSIKPEIIETLDSPSGKTMLGDGFTLFPLTDKVKQSVISEGQPMFAFAGEKAKTADLEALAAAKRMDAEGATREAIWHETGWFRGVDGRWRFEIDDSKSKLRLNGPEFSLLHAELTHDPLFDAYPELTEVEFNRQNMRGAEGSFQPGGILPSTITLNKRAEGRPRSITLHEAQHALQDIEGFAEGANIRLAMQTPEYAAAMADFESSQQAELSWTTVDTRTPSSIANSVYKRFAGEVESRVVQKRMNYTAEERRETPPWKDYDVPESQQIVRMPDGSGQAMASVDQAGGAAELPPVGAVDLGFPPVADGASARWDALMARNRKLHDALPLEIELNAYKYGWNPQAMLDWTRSEWATEEEKAWAPLIEKHAETIDAVRASGRELDRLGRELDKGTLADGLAKAAQEPRPADPAMMVYHGTEADFRKFSGETARERADTTRKFDTDVIFVTPNKAFAEGYGTPVPLELKSGFYFDLENQRDLARIAPFINSRPDAQKFWDRIEKGGQSWGLLESAEMFAEVKRLGYDGVMMSEQYHTATNVRLARTIAVFTQGKVSHRGTDDVMFSFRDWLPSRGPTPPQATEQGDSPGLNKIISDLKKTLGMPVSQGLWGMTVQQGNRSARVRPPSNVKGQFDRETGNVSVRQSRDIKTLAHEGGHYLESILGADLGVVKQGYAEALTGDPNAMPAALSEGFARWFESYILDPQAAEARAPGMTEAFEELLEAERPDMLGAFDTIQNEYQRYITSAPIGEVAAGLSSQYDGTTWRELSADKALDNVSGKLSSAYQGVVDGLNVAAKGVQYLLKTADANGIRDADGRPISIKVGDNFYKRLRLFSGAFSRGRAWLEKGVSDLETGQIIGPSLKAALEKAMGDGKFDMKRYKEFNQYLVSIRAIEEYNRLDRKAATVQQYDNTLERLAAARPTVTERVARDQATLDRRQDALTRANALLSDRRRMLGAAETRLEAVQERLQGIQDDIAEADEAFRLAGEIADPVASRAVSENYRNMVARRRRSLQIAERDQQQAVRLVERLSEEVSGLGIESTTLEAEIAQRREMVAKGRQQIAQLDETVTRLNRDRERANSAGASRPPTAEPRAVHERVIREMGTPEFQEAAQLVHDFTFSLLEARRQAGFISQELFDELAKRKDWYVPFWRDMSDIEGAGNMFPGSGVKKWSMFKKFDGSDRSILMPLEVLSEEAYSTAQQIAFNDVVKTMVGLAERVGPGGGKVAERLARAENMEANDETFGKIKQKAIELGIDPLDAHMITQRMEMNFSDGDIRVILAPENLGPTAKPQLPLWENGERVMVRLPDPAFGRDLFEAINGLGKEMSDILVKALALPAQMLRIGVTSHPDFIFRNIWRDMWTAWKLTGAVPVITQARGFKLIGEGGQVDGMSGEDFRRLYNEAGGVAGGMNLNVEVADSKRDVKALLDTNIDKKAIAAGGALLGFTGVAAGSSIGSMLGLVFGGPVGAGVGFKVGATVGGLVGGLGGGYAARHGEVWKVVESFETATRLGVAAHAYKRAKAHNPDLSDMEAITEAAFVSRDILDWNRRGSKMLAATRLVTFLNAQIQGLDKQLRQMSAQGDRGSVLKKHLGIVFKHQSNDILSVDEQRDLADAYKSYLRWAAISLMLMGLYALAGDDDDYQDIKDQTKWTHSWFKSLGIWFRLPKPFELAVPSNIGEILWDKYRGYDQRAAERVVDSMYEVLAPPGLPQVMRLAGGIMFNRDRQGIFKGQSREIVGENLASRPPHERYHAFSSEFAIDLSRAMYQAGVPQSLIPAPVKTDFVLSAAGAYWGREVQNSYQTAKTVAGMSTRPDRKATDFPLLRGVTGEAARQSESVSEMYTMISREGGEMTMAATEYKQLMDDRGRPAEAEVWLKSLDKDQQVWALTQYYGSKSDKREHPLERARQADAINREIMRDTITDTLAPKVRQGRKQVRDFEDKIELTPAKKTEVIDILARLSQVEARNTMVLLERRGFEGMSIKDPELIMQELKAASKPVYELLMERRDKKVEDWPSVQREWPRYRERVLKDQVNAF